MSATVASKTSARQQEDERQSGYFFGWQEVERGRWAYTARSLAWMALLGSNQLCWDRMKAWRSVCQQNADSRDQPKADRKMWQRRIKAARILCDLVWPKDNVKPYLLKDLPSELCDEFALSISMGTHLPH